MYEVLFFVGKGVKEEMEYLKQGKILYGKTSFVVK